MEQMTNDNRVTRLDREEGLSSWRSFAAVAAGLTARIEAQRREAPSQEESFVPVAWAAE